MKDYQFLFTANSTQFVFFGRLLVREVLCEKVLRGAKKLLRSRNLAPLPSFLALEELFHEELL